MDPDTPPSSSSSSPVMSYLINSCGLSEDRAVSIGKKLPLTTTISYLETIVATLESHGFTKSHISKIIIKTPRFLESGRCGHLQPKLDYFKSKEISSVDFVKYLTSSPEILIRGLKDKIIPLFDFIRSIVGTDRDTFKVIGNTFNDMRCLQVELIQERISGNVQVLRDEGIPERVILNFLTQIPKVCLISTDKFKERVQNVKDMGVNPHKTPFGFVSWIRMLVLCSKTTLEAKMNVLREWGWPEDQLQDAVLKYPGYMSRSIAKIEATLDYLVTQMGYSISSFLKHLGVFSFNLEKRVIPRISVHRILISKGLIKRDGKLGAVLSIKEEVFLKKFVMPYKVEAPELLQIYNQPSIGRVMGDSQSKEVTILKERETESVGALPEVVKLVDENDACKPMKKASSSDLVEPEEELDKEKEPTKARKPKKILKTSEKKVDNVQGGAAKEKEGHHKIEFDEEKKDKSKEEEEIVVVPIVEGSLSSGLKRKVTLDKEESPKKVKKPRKVLKKSKEKVEEVQGDAAKKEEEDKSKEEEEIVVVPMVKQSKNAKRSKKKFVNKDDAETPVLLQVHNQASITCVMEDSQSEEVTNCPERAAESVAAPPKVTKLVHENDAGKPKKKASSSDLVEPEEELEKEKESIKARKPRKILRKSEKKGDNEQGGATKKEKGDHHSIEYDEEENDKSKEEEEIVVGHIVGEVLEGNLASGLKRKVALDKEEDPKKVKKPMKVLKKSKEKMEEVQGDTAKKEEEDKSKVEEEIVVVPMVKESMNAKRSKKKFVNKDNAETPELLQVHNQASITCVMEDSQSEEVTNCPERAAESVAAPPKVTKLVHENDAGKPKKKASSSDLVEPEEELEKEKESIKARKPRKILRKSEKKGDNEQGGATKKEKGDHHSIEYDEEENDKSKEEEEIVVGHIVGEVLEGNLASGLKRKVALDKEEDPKKVKKPRKVLKKSKEKMEEVQGDTAKKEEEDKSKVEEEIVVVPMVKESMNAKRSKKKFVNKDNAETPELLQVHNQASITCIMEDSQSEEVTNCPERAVESVAAPPKVAKPVHENDAGKPKKKASASDLVEPEEELEKEKESIKARKILRKSEKKVDNEQGGATKKEKGDHHSIEYDEEENDKSKEEEEIVVGHIVGEVLEGNLASGLKRKVALDKEEDPKKVKKPRKVLKKSKKKVEEMQGDAAKKEEEDKSKEEEEIVVVPMVEESKIAKRPKKKFLNKDDVETPELLQVSNMRANVDSQSEEATFCPKRATESVAPLPKVAEVVDKNQVSKLKNKASSSDLVEQEEGLEKAEESKTAKKPRKILKRSKQKVEELQDGTLMTEKRGHLNIEFDGEEKDKCEEEKEIVTVPMGGRVLEGSQVSAFKRKITLDTGEDFKKIKKPRKVLKKSKKKSEEVLGDAGKKEEEDKSKEEEEIVVIPMAENASEDSQASLLMREVVLDKVQESHKVKMPKKVLKKAKKKIEEVIGSAKMEEMDKGKEVKEIADIPLVKNVPSDTVDELKNAKRLKKKLVIKHDAETPELLQASNMRAKEDSQSEEVTLCPERATESIVALPKVKKVVDKSEAGKHKKKASSRDLVEQEEELEKGEESRTSKNPTKILKRSKKKVEEVQGGAAIKEKSCHPNTEFDEEEKNKFEDEKEIVAVPMAGKVSEGTQVSPIKKKVALDKEDDLKKVKKLKKVLKKSKKKVKEVQGDATKMEEEDKSKGKDEIPAVPTVENVSEDFQASVPHEETCFQLSGKLEESQKA